MVKKKSKKGFWANIISGIDKKMKALAENSGSCCCCEPQTKSKKGKNSCCSN